MQIDDVATTPRLCRAVMVTLANDRPVMLAGGLVANGFVGPALASEHSVLGFDVLVRTNCRRDSEELAEQLPAEDAVVIQLLIAALELGRLVAGALLCGARRRHRMKIKACEEIGPEIGHALSVSLVLRQRERNSQGYLAANPWEQKSQTSSAVMG
jgi:hypothetical protein